MGPQGGAKPWALREDRQAGAPEVGGQAWAPVGQAGAPWDEGLI